MPKPLPKRKRFRLPFIIGILVILYTMLVTTLFGSWQVKKLTQKAQQRPSFVETTASVSEDIVVEEKVIAQKLDLERKMIAPKTARDAERIKAIVEKNGGRIIETKKSILVADIPQAIEESVTDELEKSNSVVSFEVDHPTFLSADTPDWGVKRIAAPDVWETTSGGGIRVAVIDTGVDYNHQDLRGRYAGGYDAVNNDTDAYDDHGHGTHVAGTVAADLNGVGLAGVSPGVAILAGKALGADGSGYTSDLIEAIDWAINNGAQVINYSLGSTYNSSALEDKINQAANRGIIQVAAAGNNSGGSLLYPAAYGAVISVAATDRNDRLAGFSAVGAEVAAPGVDITSSVPGGRYATWSGTSMAAPHVTATVALMMANKQTNIRQQLQQTAIDLGPVGRDSYYGYGLIHAKPATLGEDTLAPIITILTPENGAYVKNIVAITAAIQDEYIVTNAQLFINNVLAAEWGIEPYDYSWDTTSLSEGDYTLLIKATDENDNTGEAQITVTIGDEPTTTPTAAITRTPSNEQGKSIEVRQDIYNENAEEHRQNYDTPASERKSEDTGSGQGQSQAPETSNANARNQKSEQSEQGNGSGNGKKDVKGVATVSMWDVIKEQVLGIFSIH